MSDLIPFHEMPVNALAVEVPPRACPYVVRLPKGFTWLSASGGDTDKTTWRAEDFDWSQRDGAEPPRVRVVATNVEDHAAANKVIRELPRVEIDFG